MPAERGSQRGAPISSPQLITAPRLVPATPGSGVLEPGYAAIADGVITDVGQGPPPRRLDLALGTGVLVRLVTLAPELAGGLAAVRQLTAAGVLVSVGHSDATAAQWPRRPTRAPG